MAIIHTTPRQTATEATIKILHEATKDINLAQGKILMGQFSHAQVDCLKMSLYIGPTSSQTRGIRNVFMFDIPDGIAIFLGNREEMHRYMQALNLYHDWFKAVPETHATKHSLVELMTAATMIRNYLLFGKLPFQPMSIEQTKQLTEAVNNPNGFDLLQAAPNLAIYVDHLN
jgi:hypothetical protein